MFEGLTFKLADERERVGALQLRRLVYERDLHHLPVDDLDEKADHLVALDSKGEVVGAFRLVGPEHRPFDIESFVGLDSFLDTKRRPALVGRLCIRPDCRAVTRSMFVQAGMLVLAYKFACRRGITDLLLYTYANLIRFYRGALFEDLKIVFDHPEWGNVHLMRLDIARVGERYTNASSPLGRLLAAGGSDLDLQVP